MPSPVVKFSITHVLLIDDRTEGQQRIAELLRSADGMAIDALFAGSLGEAADRVRHRRVDVVLLDSTLPEGSGQALIVQACLQLRDLPIVVLSDDEDEDDASRALAAGAQDYLPMRAATPALLSRALRYAIERHAMLRHLERLSLTDELTGLYNRRGLFMLGQQQLESARRAGLPLLLIYADVDGLKHVNDTRGHAAGDRLLSDTAKILNATFRAADIMARIGGDEFAILAQLREKDAHRPEERLLERILAHNEANPSLAPIRLSLGTEVVEPQLRRPLGELLSLADQRMYARREARRRRRDDPYDVSGGPDSAPILDGLIGRAL